jgi:hypothetical protein
MKNIVLIAAMAAATLGVAAPAQATVTFTFTQNTPSPSAGFYVIDDFSTTAGLTGAKYGIRTLPNDTTGVAPSNASTYGSPYLDVLGGGSATYTFQSGGVSGFEFDWGSLDTYNLLLVNLVGGGVYGVSGAALVALGNTGEPSGLAKIIGDAGEKFASVTFASTRDSFEVDDLAVSAVPEPGVWAMMLSGLAMMGLALRRRRTPAAQAV